MFTRVRSLGFLRNPPLALALALLVVGTLAFPWPGRLSELKVQEVSVGSVEGVTAASVSLIHQPDKGRTVARVSFFAETDEALDPIAVTWDFNSVPGAIEKCDAYCQIVENPDLHTVFVSGSAIWEPEDGPYSQGAHFRIIFQDSHHLLVTHNALDLQGITPEVRGFPESMLVLLNMTIPEGYSLDQGPVSNRIGGLPSLTWSLDGESVRESQRFAGKSLTAHAWLQPRTFISGILTAAAVGLIGTAIDRGYARRPRKESGPRSE